MGSDSDLKVVEKAITTLKDYGVQTEVHIYSAHRTPVEAKEFTANARANDIGVIIAAAGKACYGSSHYYLFEDFYSCINEGRHFAIDGTEGAKVVRMILSVYESNKEKIKI